jgi:hypothetical protein
LWITPDSEQRGQGRPLVASMGLGGALWFTMTCASCPRPWMTDQLCAPTVGALAFHHAGFAPLPDGDSDLAVSR